MEDAQKVEDTPPAPASTDVEMDEISAKVVETEPTNAVEEATAKPSVDNSAELNNDIALTTNDEQISNEQPAADESMDIIDDKLLEDVPEESQEAVIDAKETEKLLELNEESELSEKPAIVEPVQDEKAKKVVDIEDENDTLVLSDVESGGSEQVEEGLEYNEENDDFMYDIISEGKAQIYTPAVKKGVFYNPVQEFNRDLSVAVLTVFAKDHQSDPTVKKYHKKMRWATATSETEESEEDDEEFEDLPPVAGKKCKNGIAVLDALSATGLRSMRYGLEVAGVNTVMANDMSEVAVRIIDKNIKLNQLNKIVVSRRFDAIHLMQLEKIRGRHFDAIDIDPFGNPTRFLDAAVSSLRDGGLLLVTCTDMAVLCGNSPETCYVKYNAVSLKTAACHEMALRICLHLIETVCSKYGRFIAPLLSFHADFYIRVFIKVFTSPQTCKATSTKTSMVYKCIGCNTLSFQPLGMKYELSGQTKFNLSHGPPVNAKCVHCEGRHVMAGPIWTGPLHDPKFVQQVVGAAQELDLKNSRRITGMLAVILEELEIPLYYTLTNLCSVLHCEVIPMQEFRSALLNANYKVSLSHCSKNSFKTEAPMSVVWDILRCWIKLHPVAPKRLEDSVVRNLICREPLFQADFTFHEESLPESSGLLRYQPNPEPFWGPGRKSTANIGDARPKSSNVHNHRKEDGDSPQAKRFKKHSNSIELITLSDEDDGDSLDKEIFNLAKKSEGDKKEDVASLSAIASTKTKANSDKIIEEYNLCDEDDAKITAISSKKTDSTIEEYNLCDDDDDDDPRIVNGDIKVSKNVDNKTLEDLEKELSQKIDAFDKKSQSALDIVEHMEAAEKDEVVLEELDAVTDSGKASADKVDNMETNDGEVKESNGKETETANNGNVETVKGSEQKNELNGKGSEKKDVEKSVHKDGDLNEEELLKEDEDVRENGEGEGKLDEIEKDLDTMINEEKSVA